MAPARPITQFVLKVHSRCDLACDHCYVYEHADQSWRRRPAAIPEPVARQTAVRIAEHVAAHRLAAVSVVLHGGEPLLLGVDPMRRVLTEIRDRVAVLADLDLRIHTNGVRLSPVFCDLFAEFGVKIGVSLDGDAAANDRHRRFANGRSSHALVRDALELLRSPPYRHLYAGILCTVDLANDPVAVFEALLAERPPRIDFLLPHATWDHPPPRPAGAATAYADWLGRIFDTWAARGRPVPIRLFDSLETLAAGGPSQSEAVGLDPVDLLVVETDGEWEQVDSLKTAYDGAPATGFDVFAHSADEAAAHPAVAARRRGMASLGPECQKCSVVGRCGGGLVSHRYRTGTGFRNPSVYCADLKALIHHVEAPAARIAEDGAQMEFQGLSPREVDAIAQRPAPADLVRRAARVQLSMTRALLARVGERISACEGPCTRHTADAWALLCALDGHAPDAVREVLEHPFARNWAVSCLGASPQCATTCDSAARHLAAFAIAAAARAGVSAELRVPLHGGVLYLPTLGGYEIGPSAHEAVVGTSSEGFDVTVGSESHTVPYRHPIGGEGDGDDSWKPVRSIGEDEHPVRLEDLDPYRGCLGFPLAGRQSEQAVGRWHRLLVEAQDRLSAWMPGYAEQSRACVRAIVPLVRDESGPDLSGVSRHAFGALGATLPASAESLAVTLVHESQHMLLDTVMDTHDLCDPDDGRRFTVGWRPDPRPVPGIVQGLFAHVGISEILSARLDGEAADESLREKSFRYSGWCRSAGEMLIREKALTPLGERFVGALGARLERLPLV